MKYMTSEDIRAFSALLGAGPVLFRIEDFADPAVEKLILIEDAEGKWSTLHTDPGTRWAGIRRLVRMQKRADEREFQYFIYRASTLPEPRYTYFHGPIEEWVSSLLTVLGADDILQARQLTYGFGTCIRLAEKPIRHV